MRSTSLNPIKVQWKSFWLATQLYPQNDWTGWQFPLYYDIRARPPLKQLKKSKLNIGTFVCVCVCVCVCVRARVCVCACAEEKDREVWKGRGTGCVCVLFYWLVYRHVKKGQSMCPVVPASQAVTRHASIPVEHNVVERFDNHLALCFCTSFHNRYVSWRCWKSQDISQHQ